MLSGEARRAASILNQTPGRRWRRKLGLTARTQQCQSGPTTKAWFHDRCNRVDSDACRRSNVATRVRDTVRAPARSSARDQRETLADEATLRRVRGTVGARVESTARAAWKGRRVRVAPPERDPRGCGQHFFKELGRQRSCIARRHAGSTARRRVGSTTWTSVDCNAEAGPSCRSCTASPQRRSSIGTICEL